MGGDTFKGWNKFSQIKFHRYSKNQIMSKHSDHIHTLFEDDIKGIPILSIVGVLNDDYEGGELMFMDSNGENQRKVETKAGRLIIWPSNFMFPHKVNTIKKGLRYSIVAWAL